MFGGVVSHPGQVRRDGSAGNGKASSGHGGLVVVHCHDDGVIDTPPQAHLASTTRLEGAAQIINWSRWRGGAQVRLASDAAGRTCPVAVIPAGHRPGDAVCAVRHSVMFCVPADRPGEDGFASRLWGFTGLESRVAQGLVHEGDLRQAARWAGVGYETARKALKAAMAKAGVRRQGELVGLWVSLQANGEALGGLVDDQLTSLFDLTPRQSRIAGLIAEGLERSEAAWRLGLSIHVVKAELKVVFDLCGVHTATALAILVAEIRVLDAIVRAARSEDLEVPSRIAA